MRYSRTHKSKISKAKDFVKIEKIQKLTSSEINALFRKALNDTIFHPSTGLSVEELAKEIENSPGLLYNAANKNLPPRFSAFKILSLIQASQNYSILELMASANGFFIFKVPLSRDPDPEKMLEDIFCLKILWEQLSTLFEKFYASGAEDRAVLREITEALFSFINAATQLRAAAFMKLDKSRGKK